VTATGKLMRAKGMKSHFRRRKAPRVKRMFDRMEEVDSTQTQKVKRLIPYGS
jgi:large subunit ribosomal protein L35